MIKQKELSHKCADIQKSKWHLLDILTNDLEITAAANQLLLVIFLLLIYNVFSYVSLD